MCLVAPARFRTGSSVVDPPCDVSRADRAGEIGSAWMAGAMAKTAATAIGRDFNVCPFGGGERSLDAVEDRVLKTMDFANEILSQMRVP